MDLNLLSNLKPAFEFEMEYVRDLTAADLALLDGPKTYPVQTLRKISHRHRTLARLLAQGLRPGQAAIICGYEPHTVSILQTDPAFRELVALYTQEVDTAFASTNENMAALTDEALHELRQRLEDEPDGFTHTQLLSIVKEMADRTGNGPATTVNQNHVHLHLATRLEAARKRVEAIRTIEHKELNDGP